MSGPLEGVRVVELGGLGACPFAGMMLADMGADVLRLHRVDAVQQGHDSGSMPILDRGRRSVGVDLKHPEGADCVLRLIERADVLIEGFRPGVAERLGLGPDVCSSRNPRLVYGRMTGWGQSGPLAHTAGHDINYIAVAGLLAHVGRFDQPPTIPLNLLGDFGGGGLLLAFGVVCALFEAQRSGVGQVLDAAMIDGAALLMSMMWGLSSLGQFSDERGTNMLDSGAPNYDCYRTLDGEYVAVGAVEPQFRSLLVEQLGLTRPTGVDEGSWEPARDELASAFARRTRDEWAAVFEGIDACVSPVLRMAEAAEHPHVRARSTIVEHAGLLQPAPAPRFSRTEAALHRPMPTPGQDTDEALADWGLSEHEIDALHRSGAIRRSASPTT